MEEKLRSLRIVVTAQSFIKDAELCRLLQEALPNALISCLDVQSLTSEQQWVDSLKEADGWLVGREAVTRGLLASLPKLKVIAKYGVGLDNVDQKACLDWGKKVAWEGGVNRDAVAEHTLGLMLALTRNIAYGSRVLAAGGWLKDGGQSLSAQRIGIVGLGHIGKRVAELLMAFGCDIRFCDILDKSSEVAQLSIRQVTYTELLVWSDMITFHVPLTKETSGMLDEKALKMTRSGVRIVNTSRGQVLVEKDLKSYLKSGHVAGAALDVYADEPFKDKELYSLNNFVGTAHTAGNSKEAVRAMGEAAIRGLQKELG